jgi:glucose/arabinose dehydrogenase
MMTNSCSRKILGLFVLLGIALLGVSQWESGPARAQQKKITVYLTKPAPNEKEGAVLRLELNSAQPSSSTVTEIVKGLTGPENIACGPDGKLYVQDVVRVGNGFVSRIVRYNQDGSVPQVVIKEDPNVRAYGMAFAPNGDLYFGAFGSQFAGVARLKGADPVNPIERVVSSQALKYGTGAIAFINAGTFKGDLLIVDAGRTSGRVRRAKSPDFTEITDFAFESSSFRPAGLAASSKGEVYVAHFHQSDGRIYRYSPDGSRQDTIDAINFANQLVIDSTDTVWLTNAVFFSNGSIQGGLWRLAPGVISDPILDKKVVVRGVTVCEE